MEKTESEKLELLLKALGLNRNSFSIALDYKNSNSIHRIHRNESKLTTEPLFTKILTKFPFVSVDFLRNGNLPVLLTAEERVIQDAFLYPNKTVEKDQVSQTVAMMLFSEIKALREEIKDFRRILEEKK